MSNSIENDRKDSEPSNNKVTILYNKENETVTIDSATFSKLANNLEHIERFLNDVLDMENSNQLSGRILESWKHLKTYLESEDLMASKNLGQVDGTYCCRVYDTWTNRTIECKTLNMWYVF